MDADALVAQLRPIRLPADYATLGLADALAAFALGVAAAILVVALVRPLLARREDPAADAERQIEALRAAPAEARILGLAHLLARLDPERRAPRPDDLDTALYARRAPADPAALAAAVEAAILRAARRRTAAP
ncbi:hypothetical protein [Acuticoccus sp. I52.16.1]|uniref:hypothetical protein n=1 Tax=Acuticoccus sp. I52.16.1 TaxID=2928472 RepID=UPI001FCFDCD5|nr:hypothetical protein [Acuticoccus sp. I52.16.1]UOM35566.1 hypothetical protein MRB58_04980 [Acuticoccus sp. I52.16.1]